MEVKGFQEAAQRNESDFLVIFYAYVQHQRDFISSTCRVGRWGRVRRISSGHTVHYNEGTLIIDIVARKKQELVWQGVILERNQPTKNFVEAVEKILEKFPPK